MSKPNVAASSAKQQSTGASENNAMFAPAVIIIAFIVAQLVFRFVMGDGSNFEGGDNVKGHPINANI